MSQYLEGPESPSFPPRGLGVRPSKKIRFDFEDQRPRRRWPIVLGLTGGIVLASGGLAVVLQNLEPHRLPAWVTASVPASSDASVVPALRGPVPASPPAEALAQPPSPPAPQPVVAVVEAPPRETPPVVLAPPPPAPQVVEAPRPDVTASIDRPQVEPSLALPVVDPPGALDLPPSPPPPADALATPTAQPVQASPTPELVRPPRETAATGSGTQVAALGDVGMVPAPPPPPPPSLSMTSADRLISRGLELIRDGDISGARLVLERALSSGNGRAAFLLGQTFDPHMLTEWQARGIKGDTARARELYERASQLGVAEAKDRIANLD